MSNNLFFDLNIDHFRVSFLKYTRKVFRLLPELEKPRILDIGCGSGVPTIELARLSNGEIIGMDVDQSLLDEFNRKIEKEVFSDRIRTKKCSLFEMDFPDEFFDIMWAEGAIALIGFEKGLREWNRFLKSDGYLWDP